MRAVRVTAWEKKKINSPPFLMLSGRPSIRLFLRPSPVRVWFLFLMIFFCFIYLSLPRFHGYYRSRRRAATARACIFFLENVYIKKNKEKNHNSIFTARWRTPLENNAFFAKRNDINNIIFLNLRPSLRCRVYTHTHTHGCCSRLEFSNKIITEYWPGRFYRYTTST